MSASGIKRSKKRVVWTEKSEEVFLEIWGSRVSSFRSSKKHSHIYREFADELATHGIFLSPEEIKTKIRNFTQRYR